MSTRISSLLYISARRTDPDERREYEQGLDTRTIGAVIPEPDEYLSFLMGADAIADGDLTGLGVAILKGAGTPFRSLLVPRGSLSAYRALIRAKITPGYWNDIVGRNEVLFIFKLKDGSIRELVLSEATRLEIAQLCSTLNNDPIEKTSDVVQYLGVNPLYREAIDTFYGQGGR